MKERPTINGESIDIPISKKITFGQLLNNTRKKMGSKFFSYDAINNNCQDCILNIFSANSISSLQSTAFIKQNLKDLFDSRTKKNSRCIN